MTWEILKNEVDRLHQDMASVKHRLEVIENELESMPEKIREEVKSDLKELFQGWIEGVSQRMAGRISSEVLDTVHSERMTLINKLLIWVISGLIALIMALVFQ